MQKKFDLAYYAKFVVAIIGAVVAASLTIWTEGNVAKILIMANAVFTALGVYITPNKPMDLPVDNEAPVAPPADVPEEAPSY